MPNDTNQFDIKQFENSSQEDLLAAIQKIYEGIGFADTRPDAEKFAQQNQQTIENIRDAYKKMMAEDTTLGARSDRLSPLFNAFGYLADRLSGRKNVGEVLRRNMSEREGRMDKRALQKRQKFSDVLSLETQESNLRGASYKAKEGAAQATNLNKRQAVAAAGGTVASPETKMKLAIQKKAFQILEDVSETQRNPEPEEKAILRTAGLDYEGPAEAIQRITKDVYAEVDKDPIFKKTMEAIEPPIGGDMNEYYTQLSELRDKIFMDKLQKQYPFVAQSLIAERQKDAAMEALQQRILGLGSPAEQQSGEFIGQEKAAASPLGQYEIDYTNINSVIKSIWKILMIDKGKGAVPAVEPGAVVGRTGTVSRR